MDRGNKSLFTATGSNDQDGRNIYMSADLTKGSFGHFSSFYVIKILKTSKISIFCMFLQENQIASNK